MVPDGGGLACIEGDSCHLWGQRQAHVTIHLGGGVKGGSGQLKQAVMLPHQVAKTAQGEHTRMLEAIQGEENT